MSIQRKCRDI
jgi:Transposase IS66 family